MERSCFAHPSYVGVGPLSSGWILCRMAAFSAGRPKVLQAQRKRRCNPACVCTGPGVGGDHGAPVPGCAGRRWDRGTWSARSIFPGQGLRQFYRAAALPRLLFLPFFFNCFEIVTTFSLLHSCPITKPRRDEGSCAPPWLHKNANSAALTGAYRAKLLPLAGSGLSSRAAGASARSPGPASATRRSRYCFPASL